MYTARTIKKYLDTTRLDPDYYHPMHLQDIKTLEAFGSDPMGLGGRFFAGPFGSKLPSNLYIDEGVPLFRVGNVGSMEINLHDMAYLHPSVHKELKASEVGPGDLLIVKASVGEKICKVPEWMPKANITQHIIAVRSNGHFDTDYLSAFLFGQYGRRQLIRRSLGSIIQYLGVNDARTVLVPRLDKSSQTYIGDKVRQAEQLRAWARKLEKSILYSFKSLSEGLIPMKKAWRISSSLIEPYRINPKHYNSVVLSMLDKAKEQYNLIPLGDLIDNRGVTGGATPLGAQYPSEGVFFVRVQNVSPLVLDLSDAVYISSVQDSELSRSRCAEGDIILSITGYPGTAAVVFADDLPININQHSVRFNTISGWPTAFIAAAINSEFGKIQVNRFSIGGTRDALDYNSVKSLMIPEFPEAMRMKIEQGVFQLSLAKRNSERLTIAAKLLVEDLIAGKFTESDLIAAQKALEVGNRDTDRTILSRLTRKGMDTAGEPPLFPDLDTLFSALDTLNTTEEVQ